AGARSIRGIRVARTSHHLGQPGNWPQTFAESGQTSAYTWPSQNGLRGEEEGAMATLMRDMGSEPRALSPRAEAAGRELARYGLVVVVGWIGLMKFTAYEAEGIRPFVANSPLLSWVYGLMSVRGFSAVLGVAEVAIAVLIAARPFSPRASA